MHVEPSEPARHLDEYDVESCLLERFCSCRQVLEVLGGEPDFRRLEVRFHADLGRAQFEQLCNTREIASWLGRVGYDEMMVTHGRH